MGGGSSALLPITNQWQCGSSASYLCARTPQVLSPALSRSRRPGGRPSGQEDFLVFILLHWMSYSAFILFRWIPTADLLQKRQKIVNAPVVGELTGLARSRMPGKAKCPARPPRTFGSIPFSSSRTPTEAAVGHIGFLLRFAARVRVGMHSAVPRL